MIGRFRVTGPVAIVLLVAVVLGSMVSAPAASAATTIAVTTTDDVLDPNDGVTSLREAVVLANENVDDNTIVLAASATYALTLCNALGGHGELTLTGASTVTIAGGSSTIVQTCRGVNEYAKADALLGYSTSLVLDHLTISQAQIGVQVYGPAGGGGVTLTLDHAAVTDHDAACARTGNGISVTMRSSLVSDCGSAGLVGGFDAPAILDIRDSEIRRTHPGPLSAAVAFVGDATIERSSIHHNTGSPAAIAGSVTMTDTHIDDNRSLDAGGSFRAKGITAHDSTFDRNVDLPDPPATTSGRPAGLSIDGNVTLTRVSVSGNAGSAAGLLVDANKAGVARTVTVTDSRIDDNVSTGNAFAPRAAGVSVGQFGSTAVAPLGSVTITRTSITNNEGVDNAGLHSVLATTVDESTVARNEVLPGGSLQPTGPVVIHNDLTMSRSTVDGNIVRPRSTASATPTAGAIYASTATLQYDTISGNVGDVGGVIVNGSGSINHVTLADNTGPVARHLAAAGSTLFIATALASPVGATGPSCALLTAPPSTTPGTLTGGGFNFVSDATCPFNAFGGDIVGGGDAQLGPVQLTGGVTRTRLPRPTSPLRDRIPLSRPPLCEGVDQRGIARPQGAECDIGAVEAQGAQFHPLAPVRVLDSRTNATPGFTGPVVAGSPKALTVTTGAVPASASAVVLNVTATGSTSDSFLTIWPAGSGPPTASSVNFARGQTIPNLVTAKVGTDGQVVFATSSGTTNLVVDLFGYYDDGTGPGDRWNGIDPQRVLDSRTPTGGWNGRLSVGAPRDLTVRGVFGIPVAATAVVANVTVTGSDANSFLTVWPSGQPRPASSNLNFAAGETIANGVVLPVGAGGKVTLSTAAGSVDVVVDVVGWFGSGAGDRFFPVAPRRVLDDRVGVGASGPWGPGQTRAVSVTGGPIADGASGVVANVTVTDASTGSYLSAFPHGVAQPAASTINFGSGQTIANGTTVRIAGGQLDIFNDAGTVDVIADVSGYFAAG